MKIKFLKAHGAGNDFVMVKGFESAQIDYNKLAVKLCDRHFGIGGDGLIVILPPESNKYDFRMRIFNSDGSEPEMCGNGIRCFAHYLHQYGLTAEKLLKIETLAGIITPEILKIDNKTSQVRVNMGRPHFKTEEIPVKIDNTSDYIKEYPLLVDGEELLINCVSMGNPHTIIFEEELDKFPLEIWGPKLENHKIFPEKSNVEFIKIVNRSEIIMKVWERGAGITLACGTGASAAVVAGIKNAYLDNEVLVHLPGGDLVIEWSNQGSDVYMTGPAETVFEGEIEL
ncbi:diaminopimelate epimerase [Halocella sp. SP3-1]|uniref:diaminopimelate epimerase n=1 Tax=Halocella sp. SP3-1 TaxID=2382161 RepID=UPI000F7560D8|nr:diaminopimelate epimerase [Halocella sp. SP3-1]AZO95416.1 diaminopimelate epimerase [Halocella sp. SP3-1]